MQTKEVSTLTAYVSSVVLSRAAVARQGMSPRRRMIMRCVGLTLAGILVMLEKDCYGTKL